jgi:hypothetical protein
MLPPPLISSQVSQQSVMQKFSFNRLNQKPNDGGKNTATMAML